MRGSRSRSMRNKAPVQRYLIKMGILQLVGNIIKVSLHKIPLGTRVLSQIELALEVAESFLFQSVSFLFRLKKSVSLGPLSFKNWITRSLNSL